MTRDWTDIRREIDETAQAAGAFKEMRVPIASADDEDCATRLRADLAELKDRVERLRDDELLPLLQRAAELKERYAPHLARIKRIDDVLRHALKARERRKKAAAAGD